MNFLKKISIIGMFISTLLSFNSAFAQNRMLAGSWTHEGRSTSIIYRSENVLMFCNENNDCARGYFAFPDSINVPKWQVHGWMQRNGNQIGWSNGTNWYRQPVSPLFSLNGQWFHHGQPVSIRTSRNGHRFYNHQ